MCGLCRAAPSGQSPVAALEMKEGKNTEGGVGTQAEKPTSAVKRVKNVKQGMLLVSGAVRNAYCTV